MKKPLLLLLFLILPAMVTYAQDNASGKKAGLQMSQYNHDNDDDDDEDSGSKTTTTAATKSRGTRAVNTNSTDPLSNVSMDVADGFASFQNLPFNSTIEVHITNQEGTVVLEKTLSGNKTDVDVRRLHNGLFFVTLTAGSYRKAFTMEMSSSDRK